MLDAATTAREAHVTPPHPQQPTRPKTRLPWVILLDVNGALPKRSGAALARLGIGVRTLRSLDQFKGWLASSNLDDLGPGELLVGVTIDSDGPGEDATELLRACTWDAHVLWLAESPTAELGQRARRSGATLTTLPASEGRLARAVHALLA